MAAAVGRDPTLSDRTVIWQTVLSVRTNPVVGTGYASFWLGPRLDQIWPVVGNINEAHNGYLEVYLNLGWIGLVLFVAFLLSSYGAIWKRFDTAAHVTALGLGLWAILIFYNLTESAAFGGHPIFLTFLMTTMFVPERVKTEAWTPAGPTRASTKATAALQSSRPAVTTPAFPES